MVRGASQASQASHTTVVSMQRMAQQRRRRTKELTPAQRLRLRMKQYVRRNQQSVLPAWLKKVRSEARSSAPNQRRNI